MENIKEEIKNLITNGWLSGNYKLSNEIEIILNNYGNDNYKGTPAKEDIFNAFKIGKNGSIIKPEDVRILIIGQDPYPDSKRAHGLAFSFANGKEPADDSLLNIFKAIKAYKDKTNFDSILNEDITGKNDENKRWNTNLEVWAKNNGVLLLNTALTHENPDESTIKIHTNAWQPFVNEIIKKLINSNNRNKLVVFLWGKNAQCTFFNAIRTMGQMEPEKCFVMRKMILMTSHPSPQGVKYGFKNDAPNHFKACDEFLKDKVWLDFPENNKLD